MTKYKIGRKLLGLLMGWALAGAGAAGWAQGEVSFLVRSDYGMLGSSSVVVADFDGDGVLDMVSAGGNSVSIRLGQGDGAFGPERSFAAGRGARSITAGDFDGDGRLDLVVANWGYDECVYYDPEDPGLCLRYAHIPGTVSINRGNGDGTFSPARTVSAGNSPIFVTTGDFNGDGLLDLAVANAGSGSVSVLLGQGDGAFAAERRFPVGSYPQSITLGDFNGDGLLDLAVANANYGSNNVSVLLGLGDGTFAAERHFPVNGSITVGDFNGDDLLDLAVANGFSDDVAILINNSQ